MNYNNKNSKNKRSKRSLYAPSNRVRGYATHPTANSTIADPGVASVACITLSQRAWLRHTPLYVETNVP